MVYVGRIQKAHPPLFSQDMISVLRLGSAGMVFPTHIAYAVQTCWVTIFDTYIANFSISDLSVIQISRIRLLLWAWQHTNWDHISVQVPTFCSGARRDNKAQSLSAAVFYRSFCGRPTRHTCPSSLWLQVAIAHFLEKLAQSQALQKITVSLVCQWYDWKDIRQNIVFAHTLFTQSLLSWPCQSEW